MCVGSVCVTVCVCCCMIKTAVVKRIHGFIIPEMTTLTSCKTSEHFETMNVWGIHSVTQDNTEPLLIQL